MARTIQVPRQNPEFRQKPLAVKAPRKLAPSEGGMKKKHRFRPGTVALMEIRRFQKSTDLLIRKIPFHRIVKNVLADYSTTTKISKLAVTALQESTEAYLVGLFNDANLCAIHAKRCTVMAKDLRLTRRIRGESA